MCGIFPNPTDMMMLKPFIQHMEESISLMFQKIVADVGYESEENLKYLEDIGKEAFIKPANYKQRGTKKLAAQIWHKSNMKYDEKNEFLIHLLHSLKVLQILTT